MKKIILLFLTLISIVCSEMPDTLVLRINPDRTAYRVDVWGATKTFSVKVFPVQDVDKMQKYLADHGYVLPSRDTVQVSVYVHDTTNIVDTAAIKRYLGCP